jgi:hypothetical protein
MEGRIGIRLRYERQLVSMVCEWQRDRHDAVRQGRTMSEGAKLFKESEATESNGAEGGIRTPTPLRAPAPQAGASASFATSALWRVTFARTEIVSDVSARKQPSV